MGIRTYMVSSVLLFLSIGNLFALPMGEKQIAHFEKEVHRTISEIFQFTPEKIGDALSFKLDGKSVRNMRIHSATVLFYGLTSGRLENFRNGFHLDQLKSGAGIEVFAELKENAVQALIQEEIERQKSNKRIFKDVQLKFQADRVFLRGMVDLRKIPGNLLAFLSNDFSPFSATIGIDKVGTTLHISIKDALVNNQPMSPELKKSVLQWLNPLWDFSKLPYPANLKEFEFVPGGLIFHGFLFKNE